jgi:hypothetical protein
MGARLEALQRIGLKLFAADGAAVAPRELVPIFHRWIQTRAIPEQLLIDVADYSHVPDGPGIVLVGHEGNFNVEIVNGRIALAYFRKQPAPGELGERLHRVARTAVAACRLLEDDPALGGRLQFRGDELVVVANDRLRAPNDTDVREALRPAVASLIRTLYGSSDCRVASDPDPRERLQMRVTAPQKISLREVADRLA